MFSLKTKFKFLLFRLFSQSYLGLLLTIVSLVKFIKLWWAFDIIIQFHDNYKPCIFIGLY